MPDDFQDTVREPREEQAFVPGSSTELNAIHGIMMNLGAEYPEDPQDPYTLAHVKRLVRESQAQREAIKLLVAAGEKVEELSVYRPSMSYNEAYFGEAPGFVKGLLAEFDSQFTKAKLAVANIFKV